MRDIALECGISKATLYHYSRTRFRLLRPLAIGKHQVAVPACLPAHDDPSLPAVDRLRVFMVETASFFGEIPLGVDRRLQQSSGATRSCAPGASAYAWRDRLRTAHARDPAGRRGPPARSAAWTCQLAGRMLHGAVNWMARWYDPKGPMTAAEIAERYCEMTLAGIGARR